MEHTKNERAVVLSRDTYYQVIHDLWRALPPPLSDEPDGQACRNNAAMAEVASLLPDDPAEAALACRFVAACAHAMDCMRLINVHAAELPVAMKCRAQACSMIRQACMAQSLLLRIQEARRKRAARSGIKTNEPAWSDHGILDRMQEALRRAPLHATPTDPAGCKTTEQSVNVPATRTSAAPARRDAQPLRHVPSSETDAQIRSIETRARFGRLPEPHAALRPPYLLTERPEPPFGRVPARFGPSKRDLLASVAITAAISGTPQPAEPPLRARAA